jgi:hypothetical protein
MLPVNRASACCDNPDDDGTLPLHDLCWQDGGHDHGDGGDGRHHHAPRFVDARPHLATGRPPYAFETVHHHGARSRPDVAPPLRTDPQRPAVAAPCRAAERRWPSSGVYDDRLLAAAIAAKNGTEPFYPTAAEARALVTGLCVTDHDAAAYPRWFRRNTDVQRAVHVARADTAALADPDLTVRERGRLLQARDAQARHWAHASQSVHPRDGGHAPRRDTLYTQWDRNDGGQCGVIGDEAHHAPDVRACARRNMPGGGRRAHTAVPVAPPADAPHGSGCANRAARDAYQHPLPFGAYDLPVHAWQASATYTWVKPRGIPADAYVFPEEREAYAVAP